MDDSPVLVSIAADVLTITLNRPTVMNALNTAMRAAITSAMRSVDGARVVVLTGAGRAFCAGQDLSDASALTGGDLGRVLREEYEPLLAAITECPVPVIAAVNGVAAGAGANLALACDVVIASDAASFVQAFTKIGLIPDAGGTWFLPRQIGLARAMGAALFADPVSARQAVDWGMIYEAVPAADFDAHWRARAAHLASGPTTAYRHLKRAMQASFGNDLTAQLTLEAQLQAACGQSRDFAEGVAAFLDKRPPVFTGV
jgi:2-(1,2-epoxy-1,2-dihydrophenyl)acetyl-CoA isomerase